MRILSEPNLRVSYPNAAQQLRCLGESIFLRSTLMPHYHFRKLVTHRIDRVESSCRVLGNVRDLFASNVLHLRLCQRQQVSPLEFYFSADSLSRVWNDSHYRLCRDSLSRPGFSDETNRFAFVHLKVDTVNRLHYSRKRVEVGLEPVNPENQLGRHRALFPQSWIKGIPQTIAEEVEAHYHKGHK